MRKLKGSGLIWRLHRAGCKTYAVVREVDGFYYVMREEAVGSSSYIESYGDAWETPMITSLVRDRAPRMRWSTVEKLVDEGLLIAREHDDEGRPIRLTERNRAAIYMNLLKALRPTWG